MYPNFVKKVVISSSGLGFIKVLIFGEMDIMLICTEIDLKI